MKHEWIASFKENTTHHLLHKMKSTGLLVLDDVGITDPSKPYLDFLYAIIDHRSINSNDLGTIVTTNLNAKTFREHYGDAILSRVASGLVVRWDHEDRRAIHLKTPKTSEIINVTVNQMEPVEPSVI